jgi:hypothetical protein
MLFKGSVDKDVRWMTDIMLLQNVGFSVKITGILELF